MTKEQLLKLEEGTAIYIHIPGYLPKLTTFTKKDLFKHRGEQCYMDGSLVVRPRNIRLATKKDIEDRYKERIKSADDWKNNMLKHIKEVR